MSMIQTIFSKRTLMIGLIAGSGALAASSFAMPGSDASHGGCEARHGQKAQTQRADFRAQRLAGLKDKLKLQPEQEAAWQAFVNAAAPVKAPMGLEDRQAARDALVKLNTPQRLDMMLAKADQHRANMVQRAEVVKQFYAQLSPEQQGVFDAEALPARSGHGPGGHRHQQS